MGVEKEGAESESIDLELIVALTNIVLRDDIHLPGDLGDVAVGHAVIVEERDRGAVIIGHRARALGIEQRADSIEVDVGHVAVHDVDIAHDREVAAVALEVLDRELAGDLQVRHIDIRVIVVATVPLDHHEVVLVAVVTAVAHVDIALDLTSGVDVATAPHLEAPGGADGQDDEDHGEDDVLEIAGHGVSFSALSGRKCGGELRVVLPMWFTYASIAQ